jgi:hypothetical protein
MVTHDYIRHGVLLLASSWTLHYYVLGDDPDFCLPLLVGSGGSIKEIVRAIQISYLEHVGVKLVLPKLFKINQSQDEMVDIAAPTTQCMKFGWIFEDYWLDEPVDPDRVHILVVAGREWHLTPVIHSTSYLRPHTSMNARYSEPP